ncbi:hypothetical protein AYI68_g2798, partial [Smittium mucronatum]
MNVKNYRSPKKNKKIKKTEQDNKIIVFNVPELSAETVKNHFLHQTNLKTQEFKVKKVKQRDKKYRHEAYTVNGSKLNITKPDIVRVQKSLGSKIRMEINKK